MTCGGISESSDDGAPEFKVLGESYVAYFFILPQTAPQILYPQDMIFCYPWWRLLTPRSRTLACGPADRVCLNLFGEVRLRRDNVLAKIYHFS